VINLMLDLQRDMGLAYLFIAHDLTLVRHVCHRVAVMYRGQIVEMADADQLFSSPQHAYTCRLLAAVPEPDPSLRDRRERHSETAPETEPAAVAEPVATALREVESRHWVRVPAGGDGA
jgi:ABC-type oligopeptide transport system ATPase subunit